MFPVKERGMFHSYRGNHPDDSVSISSSSILSRQDSYATFASSRQLYSATPPPPPPPIQTPVMHDNPRIHHHNGSSSNNNNNINNSMVMITPAANARRASTSNGNNTSNTNGTTSTVALPGQLLSYKAGRVKVGIRCRPAFQDEIDFAQGNYMSIVDTKAERPENNLLGLVSLTMMSGKQREFQYDYVFGPRESQDSVYDRIARPVVTDVLKGFNGTIFAYGQTGTGKTYTMGILECVNSDHAGIIPRAIAQIFDYVDSQASFNDVTVSLSFLQLYRETIQDLLAPVNGNSVSEDNLAIREDPARGFYVEGLQEFVVRSYNEAEALLNLGLENRAIAPTLMNSTSSRSHTVLTLNIEQRNIAGPSDGAEPPETGTRGTSSKVSRVGSSTGYSRIVRSKLLMVDLAGSERVRRTVSKGTRLSEAKSINTSLSALGNVIAALADPHAGHVPYRDSKLTRLLQDSLGGTASTALIATVGPAAINYGETLSTLQFATRCMAVKTTPVQHEEIDYADLCTRLQEKLSTIEAEHTEKMLQQQDRYESIIRDLNAQLTVAKSGGNLVVGSSDNANFSNAFPESAGYSALMNQLKALREPAGSGSQAAGNSAALQTWMGGDSKLGSGTVSGSADDELLALLGFCYEVLAAIVTDSVVTLEANMDRELAYKRALVEKFAEETQSEAIRDSERQALESEDPFKAKKKQKQIGSHLAPLTKLEALNRVEGHYRSNNDPLSEWDQGALQLATATFKPSIADYQGPQELAEALARMHGIIQQNMTSAAIFMARKDEHYRLVKAELADHMMDKRKREEEVLNWSFILKYLLGSSSKLRKQLQSEKKAAQVAISHSMQRASEPREGRGDEHPGVGATSKVFNNVPFESRVDSMLVRNGKVIEQVATSPEAVRGTSRKGASQSVNSSINRVPAPRTQQVEEPNDDNIDDLISEIAAGANAVKGLESIRSGSETGSRVGGASLASSHRPRSVAMQPDTRDSHTAVQSPYLDQVRYRSEQQREIESRTSFGKDGHGLDVGTVREGMVDLSQHRYGPRTAKLTQVGLQQSHNSALGLGVDSNRKLNPSSHIDDPILDDDDDNADRRSIDETSELTFTNATLQSDYNSPVSQRGSERVFGARTGPGVGRPMYLDPVSHYNPRITPNINSLGRQSWTQPALPGPSTVSNGGEYATPNPVNRSSRSEQKSSKPTGYSSTGPMMTSSSNQKSGNGGKSSSSKPSAFAQQVVEGLGVEKSQEAAALSIVDRVTKITAKQLSLLDPETRAQVMQIRQELGLDAMPLPSSASSPQSMTASSHKSAESGLANGASGKSIRSAGLSAGSGGSDQYGHNNAGTGRSSSAPKQRSVGAKGPLQSMPGTDRQRSSMDDIDMARSRSRSDYDPRASVPIVEVDFMAAGRPALNQARRRPTGSYPAEAVDADRDDESARARKMAEARRLQRNGDPRYLNIHPANEFDDNYESGARRGSSRSGVKPSQHRERSSNRYGNHADGEEDEFSDDYSQLDDMDFH